ncbi:hypothetical protein [Arthrobacter alpinus]|uniref:hypothetical protein n=1 Tax=Arthrobacter alpinus TaxID=656366 RepID=UPI0009457C53|nr:hypothetical protein [Arthrobacter alpinus]
MTIFVTAAVPVLYDPTTAWATTLDATDLGSVGVRLVDIPADTADDPRAHQYIVDSLMPGTTIQRRIEISNTTTESVKVSTYAAAASIEKGSFVGARERTANELSTWTTLSDGVLDLPGQATAEDTVTIAVPKDAAPGETYAIVWAEVSTSGGSGVKLVNRVGIRIYLDVRGDNPAVSSFTVDSMTAERGAEGNPVVRAQVHNTGGRALDLKGTLGLTAVKGALAAGPYEAKLGTTVAPGKSETVTIEPDDDLADGPWTAVLELQSGLLKESSQAEITFPSQPGIAPAAPAHETGDGSNWPMIVIILGSSAALLLLAAGIIIFLLAKKRRTPVQ